MAVETNGAYLDSVTAQADNGKVTWDKAFQRSVTEYTIRTAENASKVTLNFKTPEGWHPDGPMEKLPEIHIPQM